MKRIVFVFIMFSFLFSCKSENPSEDDKIRAKVVFVEGSVYFSSNGKEWERVKVNQLLEIPGIVKTDKASVVKIKVWQDTAFTLYSKTTVNLTDLTNKAFMLEMKKGVIINRVGHLKARTYTCKTPAITAGVRGTVFKIKTDGKKDVLTVKEGKVWAKRNIENAPEVIVTENKKIVVSVEENEKLKEKVKGLSEEEAAKILNIKVEKIDESMIKEEIEKQEKYVEKETKTQEEFVKEKSREIEKFKERKSVGIEKTVKKKSKEIEEMMNKDITNIDELLKKAKKKKK